MGILINIDNGGTFTDVCLRNGSSVIHTKVTTTPHDLTQCFVNVLNKAATEFYGEADLARLMRDTDYLRYSTTSGTNAVVERKGTPVALIVEKGEEQRLYGPGDELADDPLWRAMVLGAPVGIAVGEDGDINRKELIGIVNGILDSGARRLVVSLTDAEAERRIKEELLDRYPRHLLGAIPFLISHELVADDDDARRTISSVLNSYLHPGMEHFLYGAEKVCKLNRLARPLLIYRNDGNSARVAKTTALKTWGSGPRGGIEGAIAYARLYGIDTLVAMDIGGTTTDVSIICDGQVKHSAFGTVEGLRTSFSMPDMLSFGLGGSSVVGVEAGRIRIGPESVGASPGPACFGRGGTEATLTDALLLAGVIDGENYLGGTLKLDAERARNAIQANIAEPLGETLDTAVAAVIEAFEHQAASYLLETITSRERNPADAALLAFGGGGPMIATGIAEAAGIRRLIVPRMSAGFSAFGIGFSHLAHEYRMPLNGSAPKDYAALCQQMRQLAERDMFGEGVDTDSCDYEYALWMAVDGEVVERPLPDGGPEWDGNVSEQRLVLRARHPLPTFELAPDDSLARPLAAPEVFTRVRIGADAASDIPVYSADALAAGDSMTGPAILRSPYLTCLVKPGWSLRTTDNLDYLIETGEK